jgi:ankyrin repeat protein
MIALNSVMRVVATRADHTTDSGTGFIVRTIPTGQLILTAYHVVRGASSIRVSGGSLQLSSITARVAAFDESADIAVLMVSGIQIAHPLRLGDAMSVTPGQPLYVLGFPRPESLGDIEATFTEGIVSVVRTGLIQMQVPISSGNSGGPVLDQNGEVVGIAIGVLTEAKQEVTQQINFATWINSALPLLDSVRAASRTSGSHALTLAAGSGDVSVCGRAAAAALNRRDDLGDLPLVEAAKGMHGGIVDCLLKAGADANAAEADGTTALLAMAQAAGGCTDSNPHVCSVTLDVARTLLAAGSLVDAQDAVGATALEWAILHRNDPLATLLVKAHTNPNLRDKVNGATALMYAAGYGDEPIVTLLAAEGTAINLEDSDGRSALDYAVCGLPVPAGPCPGGNLPTLRVLAAAGASAAVRDHGGQTPMWYAARALLSKLHLARNGRPSEVSTLLSAAAHGELAKVHALAVCGAAVACGPARPGSPPGLAWYLSVAALLETHGASVWLGAEGEASRLMQAVWEGRLDVIQHAGAGSPALNAQDAEGWSPLMAAVWMGGGGGKIVEALLRQHADPGTVNDMGRTPLMYAAARGDRAVVEMLVRAGASPQTPDSEGHNAAWYAVCYPHARGPEVVRMISILRVAPPTCS